MSVCSYYSIIFHSVCVIWFMIYGLWLGISLGFDWVWPIRMKIESATTAMKIKPQKWQFIIHICNLANIFFFLSFFYFGHNVIVAATASFLFVFRFLYCSAFWYDFMTLLVRFEQKTLNHEYQHGQATYKKKNIKRKTHRRNRLKWEKR